MNGLLKPRPLTLLWFTAAQGQWWLAIVRWFRALPLT